MWKMIFKFTAPVMTILVMWSAEANITNTKKTKVKKNIKYLYDAKEPTTLSKKERWEQGHIKAGISADFSTIREDDTFELVGGEFAFVPFMNYSLSKQVSVGMNGTLAYTTQRNTSRTDEWRWQNLGLVSNIANVFQEKKHGFGLSISPRVYLYPVNEESVNLNRIASPQLRLTFTRSATSWLSFMTQLRGTYHVLKDRNLPGQQSSIGVYFVPTVQFNEKLGLDLTCIYRHVEQNALPGKVLSNDSFTFNPEIGFSLLPKLTLRASLEFVPFQAHDSTAIAYSYQKKFGMGLGIDWNFL